MIRCILFLFLLLLNITPLCAQDEITFNSGDILKAKILEIGKEEIVYKKFENLSGPSYTVKKDLIFMIKYENGTKDIFKADSPVAGPSASDAPAIIYFYRPSKVFGSPNEIIIATIVPDEVIVDLSNGHWFKSDYIHTGQREFFTGIFSINEKPLKINIESGKTYYIRGSIIKGWGMQSQIELVDEVTGKKELSGLKEQEKANIKGTK